MAGKESLEEENFFTTDTQKMSTFNFCDGANPDLVREAYDQGLVRMIYPSTNLLEIKLLPKKVKEAIKKFRTNASKTQSRRSS